MTMDVPDLRQRKNAAATVTNGSTLQQDDEAARTTPAANNNSIRNKPIRKPSQNGSNPIRKPLNRRCSYVHTEPPPVFYFVTSKRADAFLAALGAGLALSILTWAQDVIGINTMGSFLLSASIKMFYNREPPTLTAFWKSTAFCVPAGTLFHFVAIYNPKYAQSMLVSVVLLYWKLQGEIWTAANSLAVYLAVGSGEWELLGGTYPWSYLLAPYLTGHLFLYGFARAWSHLRSYVRAKLVTREFFGNERLHLQKLSATGQKERLRDLFDRMDMDGNGRLDVQELQLAFRSAMGCDMSLEECEIIMKSTDTDGDSTLDFDEFCAAIDKMAWG